MFLSGDQKRKKAPRSLAQAEPRGGGPGTGTPEQAAGGELPFRTAEL